MVNPGSTTTNNVHRTETSVEVCLEAVANVALDAGRTLMEAGASARRVEEIVETVARGLGGEQVELRIGYASLALTVSAANSGITRMRKVGPLGVDLRRDERLWEFAKRISRRELTVDQARTELTRVATETPHHSAWVIAVAVGLGCAAFGRLLGVDWQGTGPVFLSATAGQYIRSELLRVQINSFICSAVVSFVSSLLAGMGALWAGSATSMTAMLAAILLLIPGVPALNAQMDILEGRPTLGSARTVSVVMMLIFIAVGLWFEQLLFRSKW